MTEIQQMMEQFADDYDLASMNYNDKLALEVLCGLYIQVQDNVKEIEESKGEKGWSDRISELVDLNKKLISNIEQLEKQLGISRKARGKDKETTVVNYMTEVQKKAKKFLEEKLNYIYCSSCSMLLCNVWFLYPEESNELQLVCKRCNETMTINSIDFINAETTEVIQERKHE